MYTGQSKDQLEKLGLAELENMVEKKALISIIQYLDEKGNGPEAKIAVVTYGTKARKEQTAVHRDHLRFQIEARNEQMKRIE